MRKTISLIVTIVMAVLWIGFTTGCGEDEDDVDRLYRELTGTYNLFKAELTYADGPKLTLEPPEISGSMTISSDQKVTQNLEVLGIFVSVSGTFEIGLDEGVMLIDNDASDIISKVTYTWDGEILTTTLDAGGFIEKDFWRKL